MKQHIYPYLTGYIDADGTIGIRRYSNGLGRIHYRPVIEVTSVKPESIDLFVKTFGNSRLTEKHRPQGVVYNWKVTGKKCLPVIKVILPFLVLKRDQALTVLELIDRLGKQGTKWSDDFRVSESAARHELYLRAKALNLRRS